MLNARSYAANRTTAGRWTVAAALLASTVTLLAACGGSATGGSDTGSSAPEISATTDSDTASNTPVIRGNVCTASASQTCAVAGTNNGEMVVSWLTMTPSASDKLKGYEVAIKIGTNDWAVAGTGCSSANMNSAEAATSCTVTGLAAGTYSFKVAPVLKTNGSNKRTGTYVTQSPDVTVLSPQATLLVSNTETWNNNNDIILKTSGGSGTGAVSYTVTGQYCSIKNTNVLDVSVVEFSTNIAMRCVVTAKKAADGDYLEATSPKKTFEAM